MAERTTAAPAASAADAPSNASESEVVMSREEQRVHLEERASVLEECAVVLRKRKRQVQEDLESARRRRDDLQMQIQDTKDRIQHQEVTKQRQETLQRELARNLSKSRERLINTILEAIVDGSLITIGGVSSHDSEDKAQSQSTEYQDGLQLVLDTSVREILVLDSVDAATAPHRVRAMRQTCLDFQTMALLPADTSTAVALPTSATTTPTETDNNDDRAQPALVDPNLPLCPYELNGVCSDPYCSFQHLSADRPVAKILPREMVPLPDLKLPPLSTSNRNSLDDQQEEQKQTDDENNNSVDSDQPPPVTGADSSDSSSSTNAENKKVDDDDAMDAVVDDDTQQQEYQQENQPETAAQSQPRQEQQQQNEDEAPKKKTTTTICSFDKLLSHQCKSATIFENSIRFGDPDNKLPKLPETTSTTAATPTATTTMAHVLQALRLAIHAGRVPLPRNGSELANLVSTIALAANVDNDDSQVVTVADQILQQLWSKRKPRTGAAAPDASTDAATAEPQESGAVFRRAFEVQRVLALLLLHDKSCNNADVQDHKDVVSSNTDEPLLALDPKDSLREITDNLPQQVTSKLLEQRPQERQSPSSPSHDGVAEKCQRNENVRAAIVVGDCILQVLEHVATTFTNKTDRPTQQQQQEEHGTNSHNDEFVELFRSTGKLLADVIDDSLEAELDDDDNNMAMQLILAPVFAAQLALGCWARQYGAVQHRIEWLFKKELLWSASSLSSSSRFNWFLYSELLWSQLIQLRLCLPCFQAPEKIQSIIMDNNNNTTKSGKDDENSSPLSSSSPLNNKNNTKNDKVATGARSLSRDIVETHQTLARYVSFLAVGICHLTPPVGLALD